MCSPAKNIFVTTRFSPPLIPTSPDFDFQCISQSGIAIGIDLGFGQRSCLIPGEGGESGGEALQGRR